MGLLRDLAVVASVVCFANAVAAQRQVADVVAKFAPFDIDGDGRAEIERLAVIDDAGSATLPSVIVMVEGRLIEDEAPWARTRVVLTNEELRERVVRFGSDVAAGGFRAVIVEATLHRGPPHQDGRTILAMRRLFQRLHAVAPLAGAVLVGHFPDALLVRTCNWRRNEALQLPGKDGKAVAIDGKTTNVRCVPEIVAHRCDVVLADLDGDWERCYVPGPTTLLAATGVFGDTVPDEGGPCVALQTGELAVTDVFHVRDGAAIADREAFALHLDANDRDHECTAADRAVGNPLAVPEIAVSRIDARGVGLRSSAEPLANAFQWSTANDPVPLPVETPNVPPSWELDVQRERALLVAYFDRNHAFRSAGVPADHRRPASIGNGLGSGMESLRAGDGGWASFAEPGYDVVDANADLLALRRWLQLPAVLRTIRVHSDPWGGAFAATDPDALEKELGLPWHWVKDGERLVPSWRDHRGGRADFTFYRALHDKDGARGDPYLLVHTGCEALSPPNCIDRAYDDPEYGKFGHAESILFFTNCLAMVGRAKVFYDEPRGFCEALAEGKTFGEAWQRYFVIESAAKDWREVGCDIGRKRCYFWSLVGDWTLRLPPRPPEAR